MANRSLARKPDAANAPSQGPPRECWIQPREASADDVSAKPARHSSFILTFPSTYLIRQMWLGLCYMSHRPYD